jgi:hypothetical protein
MTIEKALESSKFRREFYRVGILIVDPEFPIELSIMYRGFANLIYLTFSGRSLFFQRIVLNRPISLRTNFAVTESSLFQHAAALSWRVTANLGSVRCKRLKLIVISKVCSSARNLASEEEN